ncbi:MAG: hypothetical protein AAF571_11390 [Verrucomicrobiota bacterium]
MRLYPLILLLILTIWCPGSVIAQDFEATLPEDRTVDPNTLEKLPIEDGKINVKKLTETMDTEATKILDRIREIDSIVHKAYAEKAAEIYGIEAGEYDFLRRQSEVDSKPLTQFFKSDRSTRLNAIEEAHQYFTHAYDAINKNEFWFGREETLLAKDKALFKTMQGKVATELAASAEGKKVLDLEAEKRRLLQLMETQKPLFEYLIERRKWWETYPDYEELVDQIESEKNLQLTP